MQLIDVMIHSHEKKNHPGISHYLHENLQGMTNQ